VGTTKRKVTRNTIECSQFNQNTSKSINEGAGSTERILKGGVKGVSGKRRLKYQI